jgi:hypothetical protein
LFALDSLDLPSAWTSPGGKHAFHDNDSDGS